MAVKAIGIKALPNTLAGCWKFRRTSHDFKANAEAIAQLAIELVNVNPGGGTYKRVRVRSTAENELGIDILYEIGPDETLDHKDKKWKEIYEDFFYRRVGIAYKGWDIGHSVIEITLASH